MIALTADQVEEIVNHACPATEYKGKRVLLIVPDGTRTAPIGLVFKALHKEIGEVTKALDILIALGTHQPMSDAAICRRLDISESERASSYRRQIAASLIGWCV